MDLGKINSEVGQKIISIAIFDDVLALSILGVLLNIKDTDMSVMSILKACGVSLLKLIVFFGPTQLRLPNDSKTVKKGELYSRILG